MLCNRCYLKMNEYNSLHTVQICTYINKCIFISHSIRETRLYTRDYDNTKLAVNINLSSFFATLFFFFSYATPFYSRSLVDRIGELVVTACHHLLLCLHAKKRNEMPRHRTCKCKSRSNHIYIYTMYVHICDYNFTGYSNERTNEMKRNKSKTNPKFGIHLLFIHRITVRIIDGINRINIY